MCRVCRKVDHKNVCKFMLFLFVLCLKINAMELLQFFSGIQDHN